MTILQLAICSLVALIGNIVLLWIIRRESIKFNRDWLDMQERMRDDLFQNQN